MAKGLGHGEKKKRWILSSIFSFSNQHPTDESSVWWAVAVRRCSDIVMLKVLQLCKQSGYSGWFSLGTLSKEIKETEWKSVLRKVIRMSRWSALQYCEEVIWREVLTYE